MADPAVHEYDAAFDRVQSRVRRREGMESSDLEASVETERRRARRHADELLRLSPGERAKRLGERRKEYSGSLLADALIDRSRQFLPGHPEESFEAAGLARAALQAERADVLASELYARALAHQANALRVQGDLKQANDILDTARFLLKGQGGGDRSTRAEMDRFEASLRYAQRRFPESESLYSRAIMAFAMEGEEFEVAVTLISMGVAYREMNDLDRAIEVTSQAVDILDEEHPRLLLSARHNMVNFLVEVGREVEAESLFDQIQPMYDAYADPLTLLRRIWLEGHLAKARHDLDAAESSYSGVSRAFLARGNGYDAALAALDLAVVYAEQGRTAELKRVAEEIVPIFESQDVHREAAAALMLFRDAVLAEQVTLRYVVELSRYMERARLDPSLQFQSPA